MPLTFGSCVGLAIGPVAGGFIAQDLSLLGVHYHRAFPLHSYAYHII